MVWAARRAVCCCRTGRLGDGKIFVLELELEQALRVRTGETVDNVL
jgi:nitrogen regulatory protein PII